MTDPNVAADPLDQANARIRDAAKWLVASSAAVGAALLAGSQLSSIGRLPIGWPNDVEHARLWIAAFAAVLALCGVVWAIWAAVRILLPTSVPIGDLADAWPTGQLGHGERPPARRGPLGPVISFFIAHGKYLQGFDTPAEIVAHRATLARRLRELPAAGGAAGADRTARADELRAAIGELDERIAAIESMANHEALKVQFRLTLRRLLAATAVAAVGIVAFAWAANPPDARTPSADLRNARLAGSDLRGADLRNARLDGADFTGADLTGAQLGGASVVGVVWRNTTCPDGVNSDRAGGSCAGHLS
jgi:hypothetical protein